MQPVIIRQAETKAGMIESNCFTFTATDPPWNERLLLQIIDANRRENEKGVAAIAYHARVIPLFEI
jgi:hypothetical protein